MQVLGFADYEAQARRLARILGFPYANIELHRFPDGESLVTLPEELSERIIICRSLNEPNSKLIELLLVAGAARAQGVSEITLVAPYLCYMRQDQAFHPGEAVSQQHIGRLLSSLFDRVITVDAHLHRISRLDQALPGIKAINTSAGAVMSEFLGRLAARPLLIGPDSESAQWVESIARQAGCEFAVAEKVRYGDRQVEIRLPPRSYQGQQVILIDDIISTGRTLMRIARMLFEAGASSIDALVTHALFSDEIEAELRAVGIGHIWSTDSVSHPSNRLQLDQLLAQAVR
jgi:ribose-phosphate pyrophosphokinase